LNIKSFLSLTKFSIPLSHRISMTSYLFSVLTVKTHALRLISLWSNRLYQSKSPIAASHMLHLIILSLEPASYITQISSSTLFIPLSATFMWTCRFNLLRKRCNHLPSLFNVSLWAQNLRFQKIISSTLVCFCLSDWSHCSRPFTEFICSSVLRFSSIFLFQFSYVRLTKLASSLVNFWAHYYSWCVWLIDWLFKQFLLLPNNHKMSLKH